MRSQPAAAATDPHTKRCSACAEEKPFDGYRSDRSRPDGKDSWCKQCRMRRDREMGRVKGVERKRTVHVDGVPHKNCSRCKRLLPLDAYHRDRTNNDGRSPSCRDCRMQVDRETGRVKGRYLVTHVNVDGVLHKACSTCKSQKPLDAFWRDSRRADGLQHSCKECKRAHDVAKGRIKNVKGKQRILIDGVAHKECNRCHDMLALDAYHRDSTNSDGRQTICRRCKSRG